MTSENEPGLAAIAGDWHGNAPWGRSVISRAANILLRNGPRIILQAGDFGVWYPPGERNVYTTRWGDEIERDNFLDEIEKILGKHEMELWFIDGNHEDHPLLQKLTAKTPWITPRIKYLARGSRWEWHGKKWLALGGAVSVDRGLRVQGKSWFPEEEITGEQAIRVKLGGKADVILSHDCPSWVPLKLADPPPAAWLPHIPAAQAHREIMTDIAETVHPSWIFHGHYHTPDDHFLSVPWGAACKVISLDMDGREGNWGILNLQSMTWEP